MLSDFRYRLRALFRRNSVERDLDDELQFHLERQKDKYIASGMPANEAARRVRIDFGTTAAIRQYANNSTPQIC